MLQIALHLQNEDARSTIPAPANAARVVAFCSNTPTIAHPRGLSLLSPALFCANCHLPPSASSRPCSLPTRTAPPPVGSRSAIPRWIEARTAGYAADRGRVKEHGGRAGHPPLVGGLRLGFQIRRRRAGLLATPGASLPNQATTAPGS
jgi:hypothetical protein